MNYYFEDNGLLIIDGAKIANGGFRQFSGKVTEYNREGKRKFAVVIEDEAVADDISAHGWRVRVKPPQNPGDRPFMYIEVNISFKNDRGPIVHLKTGRNDEVLNEGNIGRLDKLLFDDVSLVLRPYSYDKTYENMSAWLSNARFTQKILDRFAVDDYPTE